MFNTARSQTLFIVWRHRPRARPRGTPPLRMRCALSAPYTGAVEEHPPAENRHL